ncbi:CinA-like protein [Pseudomonas coronafaciens pv. coronafaciens]|uniref:CinA family protein n=1 Tax=Pseudomonas coronafaciens TaxID=53409 RepID=UPI000EFDB658|nr:CinA family protein [Pseudomonas coronafaciens]RMP24728.1 CinA-like protein [Pseudomonas coronafaciens pv. atropurpurea]RMS13286.1 CinA-like protein [Pseudomonas coronafaciens pv. coronafaciens]RMV66526.1 CinA-like protein [Pseudomonas coronafaciens pv. atropurpurea]
MPASETVSYLQQNNLLLATAESCTAGRIVALLAEVPGSGSLVDCGYVVYSPEAKHRLLGVKPETIERFNLTSVEVAQEMAEGALQDSPANVAIATTGLCGTEDVDGIPAGTVCFAWGFVHAGRTCVFTEIQRFSGDRETMQHEAALHALERLPYVHLKLKGLENSIDEHPPLCDA